MSKQSTLDGHIKIPKSDLQIFKQTKLNKLWINVSNSEIPEIVEAGENLYIFFNDFDTTGYQDLIIQDLKMLTKEIDTIKINLFLVSNQSDITFTAEHYFIQFNNLIVQNLQEAHSKTILLSQ